VDPTQWGAPFPIVVTALFCIVLTRANATYWAGRLVARGAHRTRAARWMDSAGYRRAVERLNRWGAPAVSLSFLTVGVQTVINLAAGAARMPLVRYIPATVVGSVAWAFLYGTVGFVGFEALALLWEHSPAIAIAAGVAAVAGLAWFVVRQTRRATLDTDEA
jgi:membrane protein DedA with SNARE-associated domain